MGERRKPKTEFWLTAQDRTEASKVDAWLHEHGVQHGISDLYEVPFWSPDCIPQLIELLKTPLSVWMTSLVADALFFRKPDAGHKRAAIDAVLSILKQRAGESNWELESIVYTHLRGNVERDKVHGIAEMALDPRYGTMRDALTHVLGRIPGEEKVEYLLRAANDPETVVAALDNLARLRPKQALGLCEKAMSNPRVDRESKGAIKAIHAKLKRRLAKRRAGLLHVTSERRPAGLEEWSINLAGRELPKALRVIQRCIRRGFSRAEAAEIRAAADDLPLDDEVRFKFEVEFKSKKQRLWIEMFCDDEADYQFYVFGTRELIGAVTEAESRVFKDKSEAI